MGGFEPARIETLDEVTFEIKDRLWPFARDEAAAVDRHWETLRRANPHLFNGRVFLNFERSVETRNGRRTLSGVASETEFKTFLAWRDFGFPDRGVRNCFAMAVLVSADGAFILGRMAEATANAGKIYFPAGTPDPGDARNGRLDLEGSVARELLEETGIAPAEAVFEPGWRVVFDGPRIACMKTVRSPLTAAMLATRFARFAAAQDMPELAGLHAVFSEKDLDEARMPDFTLRYLRDELARR